MCSKPNAQPPRYAAEKGFFLRQPFQEIGEQVSNQPPPRRGAQGFYAMEKHGDWRQEKCKVIAALRRLRSELLASSRDA